MLYCRYRYVHTCVCHSQRPHIQFLCPSFIKKAHWHHQPVVYVICDVPTGRNEKHRQNMFAPKSLHTSHKKPLSMGRNKQVSKCTSPGNHTVFSIFPFVYRKDIGVLPLSHSQIACQIGPSYLSNPPHPAGLLG